MPEIKLVNVTKRFGKAVAVDNLNLSIADGDFVTLLGPSGCGKTTTLRMIAGLETPTEGEIYIDGKLVFSSIKGIDVPADKRGIGFLFQNYALWPHMTVRKNITLGLENLKWSKQDIEKRLNEMLQMMHIEEYVDRYPSELSGGQQQRVAIARTLATKPPLLLMDEPLSNLDAKLRLDMRGELKKLHVETGSTFVYVTHDQQEAMSLSTNVCLMKDGLLQQYSAPLDMYSMPNNTFVADFLGSPSINLIPFKKVSCNTGLLLENNNLRFKFKASKEIDKSFSSYTLGIRPELITIGDSGIDAVIDSSFPYGMETVVSIRIDSVVLRAVVFGKVDFQPGQKVKASFNSTEYALFSGEDTSLLSLGSLETD